MKRILEVCVDSYASAMAAVAGGADRLELCSALSVGGLTPSAALLRQIRRVSDVPIRCLMRPRGGDFLYTPEEVEQMTMEMAVLRNAGADGFVIGCLTAEGELDGKAMEPLRKAASGLGLTLHRCIDVSRNLEDTYRNAANLGFDTVLTSGGAGKCRAIAENPGRRKRPGGSHRRGGQCRCHCRLPGKAAGSGGLPHERKNGNRKQDALSPGGCAHGPAGAGRVAYSRDQRGSGQGSKETTIIKKSCHSEPVRTLLRESALPERCGFPPQMSGLFRNDRFLFCRQAVNSMS